MSFTLNIDVGNVVRELDIFSKDALPEMKKELEKVSEKIVKEARTNHRFKTRTNNLVESTKKELDIINRKKLRAQFRIDEIKAPYGVYVHDGTKYRHPDKYLENAVKRNIKNILRSLDRGLNNARRKAGL